jgi:hypothetical protein
MIELKNKIEKPYIEKLQKKFIVCIMQYTIFYIRELVKRYHEFTQIF